MLLKNSLIYINQFFFFIFTELRKIYLKSNIYNNKISKIDSNHLDYKPSPSLLDGIIKYSKNRKNISDFSLNNVWSDNKVSKKDFKKLHGFFWLFTLDLNSSKKDVQNILLKWFKKYHNYNAYSWEIDLLSKRIISWISNTKITYEGSDEIYKNEFDYLIKKQVNHLINEIDRSEKIDDKIIGCAAIILAGVSFNDKTKFLNYGLSLLNRIIRNTFDRYGFPKSRNLRQLTLFLKYFILIREWLKESQNDIPEYLDEIIYHLGQAYNLINKNSGVTFLFNGSQISNHTNHVKGCNILFLLKHPQYKQLVAKNWAYLFLLDLLLRLIFLLPFQFLSLFYRLLNNIIGLLYVFYVNYEKESITAQNDVNIEMDLNESINESTHVSTNDSFHVSINESINASTNESSNESCVEVGHSNFLSSRR